MLLVRYFFTFFALLNHYDYRIFYFLFYSYLAHPYLHSFPTRRSSDLSGTLNNPFFVESTRIIINAAYKKGYTVNVFFEENIDRKSTRLNSSHLAISYAVFCLKQKKKKMQNNIKKKESNKLRNRTMVSR